MENKITSFEDWFNNHEFNHLKTGSHKERCEIAWTACAKMKDEEFEKEGFTLSANQCCAEDCGIHFEEGTSLFCKHEQENKRLKEENFKMRCCGNCQRRYDGACYEYDNVCAKWEIKK